MSCGCGCDGAGDCYDGAGLGDLGDIICSSTECTDGATSVNAMDAYFQALDPGTQSQYQQQHDAIMAQFNAAYSWYSAFIPFNPTCCTVQTIGQAADSLLCAMQGGQNCVKPSSGGMSLESMILIGAGLYFGLNLFLSSRR